MLSIVLATLLAAAVVDRRPKPVVALYVDLRGPYPKLLGASRVWVATDDARTYPGPFPVVAHPPCGPWGRYAHRCQHVDRGEVAAALADIAAWGGVFEHPAGSRAWAEFQLPRPGPVEGQWTPGRDGWWSTWVDQGRWEPLLGRKRTWLAWHAGPSSGAVPPPVPLPEWSGPLPSARTPQGRVRGGVESLWSQDPRRWLTPEPFARVLVELAERT